MASLNLYGGEGYFEWDIDGLSAAFNSSNYLAAAIAPSYQGDGISSLTYTVKKTAPSSRSQTSTPTYTRTCDAGTYTYYGYAQALNGKWYYCGADSCVVTEEEIIPYYTVDTIGYNNFDINWYQTRDYPYLRLYVRTTGGTVIYDQWIGTGGYSSYRTISGLSAGTTYVVNVAYNTSASASGSVWIGSQTVTTDTPPTYTYFYRARIFVDGSLYDYTDDSVVSTASGGYNFTLQEVKDMVSIPSHTTFSYATNGNSYCTYSNGYFSLLSSSQTYRAYMDLYYTTDRNTLTAGFYDTLSRNALTVSGGGSYNYGTTATLRATITDSDTFEFVGWYDSSYNLYSTSTAISVNVTSDMTFYARAKNKNFTLSVYDYYDSASHYRGQYTIQSGTEFNPSIYSSPPSGYRYNHAECPQGTTVTSVTMSANKSLYLYYDKITYSASAQIGSGYSGMISSVSANPTTVNSGGTSVFTAVLVSGYEFLGWYDANGNRISTDNPYTATITGNTTLYARAYLSPFSWTYSHSAGTSSVSKAEWRRLQTFINRKRTAAGQSSYSFSAFKGYVTPTLFNEAAEAIGINDRVSHGEAIHKSHFTRLATAANNM